MKKKVLIISLLILVLILIVLAVFVGIINKNNNKVAKDEEGYYMDSSTINGRKPEYNNPIIPKGFKTVDTENSKWNEDKNRITSENLENGLVIEDKKGNQFVWVPVDKDKVNLTRKIFEQGNIKDAKEDEQIDRIYYSEENENSCLSKYQNDEANKYYSIQYFKESVEKYGGFYIARFETGKDEKNETVVKKDCIPYTNITRDEALNNSIQFIDNNEEIVTSLINSYAWDTALQFISKTNPDYSTNKEKVGTGKLSNTGQTGDVACNIYDLSGNIREWSTEYSSNGYYSYLSSCVVRGGYYNNSTFFAASRYYNGENVKNEFIGYRMILYIK